MNKMVLNWGSLGGYGGSEKGLPKEQEIKKNMMMTMKKSERGEEWWESRMWNVKGGVLVSLAIAARFEGSRERVKGNEKEEERRVLGFRLIQM